MPMFTPVDPVQASVPPAPALIRVGLTPADAGRWEDGFAWRPERCTSVRSFNPCGNPVAEVQTITITGDPTGGTFTLTHAGQTTAGIAYNANAAAVQAALEALSNLAPGDVSVTGGPGPATPYTVRFNAALGNVGQMTASGAGLTGGTAPAVNVATVTPGNALYGPEYGAGESDVVYYLPAALVVEDVCSTRSGRPDEGRIRRQVQAATAFALAHELWTGEASDANPYDLPGGGSGVVNARLAGPTAQVVPGGVHDPLHGLGALEDAARKDALGQEVWIHVPLVLLPLIEDGINNEGGVLTTRAGSRIVADAGYLGTGPNGQPTAGAAWMYATGPVQVRLSEPVTEIIHDVRRNEYVSTGRRMYAATFDPCIHHGVAVDLPDTTP